jgi:hypothetical protein
MRAMCALPLPRTMRGPCKWERSVAGKLSRVWMPLEARWGLILGVVRGADAAPFGPARQRLLSGAGRRTAAWPWRGCCSEPVTLKIGIG